MRVKDLNNRDDLVFVSESQEVDYLNEYLGQDFGSYFIKAEDGNYTEVYGMNGIVPGLDKNVYKIEPFYVSWESWLLERENTNSINSLVMLGRRWFDRVNGNTYHTVSVWVNHKFLGKSSMEYGYGDQYLDTALHLLQENGYFISKDYSDFIDFIRFEFDNVVKDVVDVGRKKDL